MAWVASRHPPCLCLIQYKPHPGSQRFVFLLQLPSSSFNMSFSYHLYAVLLAITFSGHASAASASACATTLTPTNSIRPTVASGYQMALVATGLTSPRSMEFDSSGNLIVVEQGSGILNLVLDSEGPCINVRNAKTLIRANNVSYSFSTMSNFPCRTERSW